MIYYYLRQMLEKLDELELFTRRRILQGVARIMTTEFPMEFVCDMQLALEAYYPDYDLKSFLIREDKIYYYDAFLNTLTLIDRFTFQPLRLISKDGVKKIMMEETLEKFVDCDYFIEDADEFRDRAKQFICVAMDEFEQTEREIICVVVSFFQNLQNFDEDKADLQHHLNKMERLINWPDITLECYVKDQPNEPFVYYPKDNTIFDSYNRTDRSPQRCTFWHTVK